MGFEMRKKGKFEKMEEFATRMKEIHKEAEAALKKSQEKMSIRGSLNGDLITPDVSEEGRLKKKQ